MTEHATHALPHASQNGQIDHVARKYRIGEEPSLVDEYARFTIDERLEMFLRLRQRIIEDHYGTDPGFERIYRIARRA